MRLAISAVGLMLLLLCDPSAAAKRTIEWEDLLGCANTVEFDDTKYDEMALRNTIDVLFNVPPFPSVEYVAKPEDIAKLDLERLKSECTDTLARAEGLTLISLSGLKDYWSTKIEQLRDACAYGAIEIRGYTDPSALREYRPAAASCSRYVDALEGKTDIVPVWRETIAESCRRNIDPSKCVSGNLAKGSGPNAAEWIRLFVHSFGWNNCANKFMKVNTSKDEPVRSELERRFKRLFKTKRDETCH